MKVHQERHTDFFFRNKLCIKLMRVEHLCQSRNQYTKLVLIFIILNQLVQANKSVINISMLLFIKFLTDKFTVYFTNNVLIKREILIDIITNITF